VGRAALRLTSAALPLVAVVPLTAPAGGRKDPFDALGVHQPAEPFPAPDLTFRTLDGRETGLKELRGRIVLLGFFTTT
jgi:cytochrome oxidase Cu insertion factor (SCO1/SenC/PrrC family)